MQDKSIRNCRNKLTTSVKVPSSARDAIGKSKGENAAVDITFLRENGDFLTDCNHKIACEVKNAFQVELIHICINFFLTVERKEWIET
jgi:hypothetical protein